MHGLTNVGNFINASIFDNQVKSDHRSNFFQKFKGPFKYLVAKLRDCYPGAISLPVSEIFFARFFWRRPVADSSRW